MKTLAWISLIMLAAIGGAVIGFATWTIRGDVITTIMSVVAFALIAGGGVGVISVLTEPEPEPERERVLIERKPKAIAATTDYIDAKYRIVERNEP